VKARIENLAPHNLRRTWARLCHLAGGELEQIRHAGNDAIGLEDAWAASPKRTFGRFGRTSAGLAFLFELGLVGHPARIRCVSPHPVAGLPPHE
jgi:hypothetical protein